MVLRGITLPLCLLCLLSAGFVIFCSVSTVIPVVVTSGYWLGETMPLAISIAQLQTRLFCNSTSICLEKVQPCGKLISIVKSRLTGNQSRCGWCYFLTAVTLCIYFRTMISRSKTSWLWPVQVKVLDPQCENVQAAVSWLRWISF